MRLKIRFLIWMNFAKKCVECLENEVEPGIYNMTNPGSVTTKQVTEWMKEEGVTDKKFQFFEDEDIS